MDNDAGDTFTYTAVNLPAGMAIASATGIVSGTPTEGGTFTVKITVEDKYGNYNTYNPADLVITTNTVAAYSGTGDLSLNDRTSTSPNPPMQAGGTFTTTNTIITEFTDPDVGAGDTP